MANEGVLAALEKEFRPLLAPKLLAEAKAVQVVWARVKGYPAWPAQVLAEAAALRRKDLGQERHSKGNSVPVMFFGTVEVAWVKDSDVVDFKEGLYQGFFDRKTKHFRLALEQVCEYLALDRKRKAPPKWWCKPPSNGLDDQSDGPSPKLVSAAGSGAAKGSGQRHDSSKNSRQRPEAPDSDTGSSSGEDEAHVVHGVKKGSSKIAGGKDGAASRQQKDAFATAPAARPRDSSTGRLPRENGSTAASTNTAAHAAPRKPPAPPPAAAAKQQAVLKEATPPGDAVKGTKETRHGAIAATSNAKAPLASQASQPQPQRLRSSAGASAASAKENDADLQPRKRMKVEAGPGTVVGPTAASASSLPPPAIVVAKRTTSADDVNAADAAAVSAVDVLRLPAEIRRLAGIRLPALPKKLGIKVEESPREQPPVKMDQGAGSTAVNASATALKPSSTPWDNAGMELRSTRHRRSASATPADHLNGERPNGTGQKRSRRDGSSSAEDSKDGKEEEENQNSGDSEAAASSSSDEGNGASDDGSDADMAEAPARRVVMAVQTRAKVQSQQPPARDHKAEAQRRLTRLSAPHRRTSSRLNSKAQDTAALQKTSSESIDTTNSDDESEEVSDDDSENGVESEDERSNSAGTSSSSGESGSEEDKVSGGGDDGGIRLRSQTRAQQAKRAAAKGKVRADTASRLPSREDSQPADCRAKASTTPKGSDSESPDEDKKPRRLEGSAAISGPVSRAIPLELRRLKNSPTAGAPVVDTSEPRTLRDRSSPARRTIASTGVTPTQTAIAGASAGAKRSAKRASEDGSGASMSMVVERPRSPEHRREGQKAGPPVEGKIPLKLARSQAFDGRCSKAGSGANSASPPPAPMPGGVPVRKKPPSLGIPSTARSAGQAGTRQLPAITPARALLRSLASTSDGPPSSALPSSGCGGISTAGISTALLAPVAVRVLKKPSTGPPTRRLVEPGLEAPISPTDLPDAMSLDFKADPKHVLSPGDGAADAVATADGQLPPDALSLDGTLLKKLEDGRAADEQAVLVGDQLPELLPPRRQQQVVTDQGVGHHAIHKMLTSHVSPRAVDEPHLLIVTTTSKAEVEQAKELSAKQPQQEPEKQLGSQKPFMLCLQPPQDLEPGNGMAVEQQDQVDPQPSSCCQQVFTNILTEPVEQAPVLPSRSSVVHDQDHERANRSPGHALSAPAQLQHGAVEQGVSALGAQVRSNPGSPLRDVVLISEEQLPDQGEAMAEHDGHAVAQVERLTLGASGGGSDAAFTFQVTVAASEAVRELPSMPSPPPAAPVTPPEGHVASASGVVSVPPACAGSRASSEAECGAGAPGGVSGASCSAPVWREDDEAAARARARELEELGEVAAALAGLHQAEMPRPLPARLVTEAAASQLPTELQGDSLLGCMRSRVLRGLPRSGGSRDNLLAHGSAAAEAFRWPQPEPLLPSQEQPFALPRDWLVTRPPRFEPVKRNLWLSRNKPKRLPKDEINICACRAPPFAAPGELQRMGCGPNCLNRLSSILCDAKLCPCGELCSNRSLHLLRQPKTEVFLTDNRGWGVRTMEPLSKGAFIIEYAGEVIDERELGRRMEHARMNGEPHFYIMELSAGLYIDARRKGNIARLINSSCDPNCETQKWHDASTGEVRVGIFASRDIPPGEELVYDYFFSTYGALKPSAASFICMCGSKNCRGTMDLHPEKRRDLGRRVEVFWDADGQYYRAVIVAYHPTSKKHTVMYEDGGTEKLSLDEVPHRWLDDDRPRMSTEKPDGNPDDEGTTAQPSPVEPQLQQQQSQAPASTVDVELADVLPVPDRGRCSVAAVLAQAPPRPLIPIDQRCLLPPLGSASMDAASTQTQVKQIKHGMPSSDMHLPLKKRPRMLQPVSSGGQQLPASQLSPLSIPVGTSSRDGEAFPGTVHQQISGGSGGCVAAPGPLRNRRSGGGTDSAGGEQNGFIGRTSLRHDSSVTASGRISSVVAEEEEDPNEDLDSLLEAAEAVAALRTAPISNPPSLHAPHDSVVPLQPRHIRSGSLATGAVAAVAMVQTAKAASPRHLAAVQRAGPPNGLPPHGGNRPSGTATALPSSSSSGFISYQAGGSRQHHGSHGSAHLGESMRDCGVDGASELLHHLSHARNGRIRGEHDDSGGPLPGSRGRNSIGYGNWHGPQAHDDIDREDLLWKLVGIEKPKNLLPLFAREPEKPRNGDVVSKAGDTWISPSHPYGRLLHALEASELLPHADQLRLLAHQHAQQQAEQHAQQRAQQQQGEQLLLQQQQDPQQQQQLKQQQQQQLLIQQQHHQLLQQQPHLRVQQRVQQQQSQPLSPQPPTQPHRPSGTLPPQQQAGPVTGPSSSTDALTLSAWHQLTQQHAQHQHQHQQHHTPNGNPYMTHGLDSGAVAAFLHNVQQQQAAATAAAATVSSGPLHHQLHPLPNHESYILAGAGAPGAASTVGLSSHVTSQQQQLAASAAAGVSHWQPPAHVQPGSVMQDLVQLYVAQHAAGSHSLLAMAGATTAGSSRA